MSNDNDDGKVVQIGLVPEAKQEIPESNYVIYTLPSAKDEPGEELYATGFLLFTSHHVAVMRDTGLGALPVLVVPLDRVRFAELVEDEDDDLPF